MNDSSQTPLENVAPTVWDEDVIFTILGDPVRRALFRSLALNGPQPAVQLKTAANRKLDTTIKQLTAMRAQGLVLDAADPNDKRRRLYRLAPTIAVTKTETGCTIDLGFSRCALRLHWQLPTS